MKAELEKAIKTIKIELEKAVEEEESLQCERVLLLSRHLDELMVKYYLEKKKK